MMAEEIAAKLSPAMKKAMLHRNAGGSSYAWTTLSTAEALHKRGLVGRIYAPGGFWSPQTSIKWPLTPLGLSVRAALTKAMTEAEKIAKSIPNGAKRACLRMTAEWQFAGKATFSANGAHSLYWAKTGLGRGAIVECESRKDGKWSRYAYRLTPLGLEVRAILSGSQP